MIDNAENLDEPEGYQSTKSTATIPTEILPAEESSDSPNEAQKINEPESAIPEPVLKKVPPPIPSKPDHLKIKKTIDIQEPASTNSAVNEEDMNEFLNGVLMLVPDKQESESLSSPNTEVDSASIPLPESDTESESLGVPGP